MIMNSLLMETRVNSKQNFNSLKGGKYDIKDGIRLIDCLLDKNYIEPITPLIKSNCPVIIDLDFRVESTDEPRQEGIDQMLIDVAHELLKILNEVADFEKANVILTRRDRAYKKKDLYCSGMHVYVPSVVLSTAQKNDFQMKAFADPFWYELVQDFYTERGAKLVSSIETTLDSDVGTNKTLTVIGGNKPNCTASPHYVFFHDEWRTCFYKSNSDCLGLGWQHESPEALAVYKKLLERIYRWVFTKCAPLVTPKKKICVPEKEDVCESFNLKYFTEKCPKIEHGEWLQLVYYCRISGLRKDNVCKILNEAYKPNDLTENERVWDSFKGVKNVGSGSIVRMMNKYTDDDWCADTLFPVKTYLLYHEIEKLGTECKVHTYADVSKLLKMFLVYISRNRAYAWYRREFSFDGTKMDDRAMDLDKHAPFTQNDDFMVRIYPTKKDYEARLDKMMGQLKGKAAVDDFTVVTPRAS